MSKKSPYSYKDLVFDLVRGIEAWAEEDEGVHEAVWDAYVSAKDRLREQIPVLSHGARQDDHRGYK